jgi:hypothetical protein
MFRRALLSVMLVALVFGWSAGNGRAQGDAPRADRQVTITLDGGGPYLASMGGILTGAFDRAMQELDAFPEQPSPDLVKDATVRRRLLELRLLMDFGAYAYDPVLLDTFRKVVDTDYEEIGDYQDVSVTQSLLQFSVRPDVVSQRLIKMNVVLSSLRTPMVRSAMKSFLSSPASSIQTLAPKDTPRLWQLAQATPSEQLDTTGNAALLAAKVLRAVQASDPFVSDIFDRPQEEKFHATRKDTRSVMLLALMFPDTRQATRVTSEPLFSLISQFGDVNDAVTAYRTTLNYGGPQDAAANLLRSEFTKAQGDQGAVVSGNSYEAVASILDRVQAQHRK